jgi:hypothetical protein
MQFPLLGLARDFHPLDNAHAERTSQQHYSPHSWAIMQEKPLFSPFYSFCAHIFLLCAEINVSLHKIL